MKNITTTLCAAVLTLAPASLFAQAEAEPKAEAAATTIEITCNDSMQFDKKEFELKAGETVSLTLKNVGVAPKIAMGHNLIILKADANLMAFANKAMTAKETDYVPADKETADLILAHTKLLGPGESDTITFTAPAAGTYEYLCSFPGHFALMKGKITVK